MRPPTMKNILIIAVTALTLLAAVDCPAFNCSMATSPVSFGLYDVFASSPLDSTGGITVNCSNPPQRPITVTVTLSAGSSGSYTQRQMKPATGSGALLYNLYVDTSMTTVLGDGSGGSTVLTNVVTRPITWSITIYGRIPARQNVVPGIYSDTLTATVLW